MIPKECKRLAEVDFPIAVVSKHSAREKSIRHGHPSTLHLWWARRPLAACRSMLLALLLPDPCDPHCPDDFKPKAAKVLLGVPGYATERMKKLLKSDMGLRKALLKFIGDVANWDVANNPRWIGAARELVKAAHPEETPLVVDPFAGGGSIPLEALRIGCEAFASDLNPVACLILKVMLEDIPREARRRDAEGAESLADELRRVGKEIKEKAEKELREFYPDDPDGARPIAYLWARTVRCESPNCGAEIPLISSFWLAKTRARHTALRYKVATNKGGFKELKLEVFSPKTSSEVPKGIIARSKAQCPICKSVLDENRIAAQLILQSGGTDPVLDDNGERIGGAILIAVVTRKKGVPGRFYRSASASDYFAIKKAQDYLRKCNSINIPNENLERVPVRFGVINVRVYGMDKWEKLFSARQKVAIATFARILRECITPQYLKRFLVLPFGKLIDFNTSAARWANARETSAATFGRPAIPMVWDFCETVPISKSTGSWQGALEYVCHVIEKVQNILKEPAAVNLGDARDLGAPHESFDVYFTDPPYYDNVPYSYISDIFYIWQKRILEETEQELYSSVLTPKDREIVAYVGSEGDKLAARVRFEEGLSKAFLEGSRTTKRSGLGCVVFAHQTTEGWESLVASLIRGGWVITSSWPISTERSVRPRAQASAALATSVHLVCRPRPEDAPVGDWADVLRELPSRVGDWMERLQGEGIRGADLVFACIGPALEIFSRYSKVESAEGREVELAEYLEKVWEVVGRLALEQVLGTAEAKARNGAAGAVEEDARLTALFLWTLQSTNGEHIHHRDTGSTENKTTNEDKENSVSSVPLWLKGFSLPFDVVRRFAQPLGIDLPKWEGRIIETKKGVVRLLSVSERAKQLFGEAGLDAAVEELFSTSSSGQMILPGFEQAAAKQKRRRRDRAQKVSIDDAGQMDAAATTLDRVHAAMLLQAGGQANALRALIKAEQERGPDFLRLANALSALYPKGSEEKRLIDAMLLAVPR